MSTLAPLATNLLRALGASAGGAPPAHASTIGTNDFASLLDAARAGEIASGISVSIAPEAGVEVSGEQLARLAQAADLAEAHGASRAGVVIDGRVLTLDVATRTITGEVGRNGASVMTDLDAVVHAPASASWSVQRGASNSSGLIGASLPTNASLLALLSGTNDA